MPTNAFYGPDGEWVPENYGVTTDIKLEQDPAAVRAGRDPQLERAVEEVLSLLEEDPRPTIKRPPYKILQ